MCIIHTRKEGIVMNSNKGLKIFSIILECSFIGSIILYVYNYYLSSKKFLNVDFDGIDIKY